MTTFDLWIKWCTRLQEAGRAVQSNMATNYFWEYVRAYRYALRRCEGLERALTCE